MVDGDRDEIVIRILYDGPPLAGKTTSLKALMNVLAARRRSELFTPAEVEGRTLYFDWMDYLGGWFDGNQVRCQIVAAPGQKSLAKRRETLLQDADVVVLVLEATPAGTEAGVEYFGELCRRLPDPSDVPIPIIVQANKQDLPLALSEEEVRSRFRGHKHVAILGASASEGAGVREVFTFAVRLALDRVRELGKKGLLEVGIPSIRTGEDLLARIEETEVGSGPDASSPPRATFEPADPESSGDPGRTPRPEGLERAVEPAPPPPVADEEPEPQSEAGPPQAPALPTSKVASGLVWPPITGRVILHECERSELGIRRSRDRSWSSTGSRSLCLDSRAEDVYADLEEGRAALLQAARAHAALAQLVSNEMALVLADTGDGRWRMWRIRRREISLLDRLIPLLEHVDGDAAERIFRLADALIRADLRFRTADAPLEASLGSVGICNGAPCYVGELARDPGSAPRADELSAETLIRREFGPHLVRASREGAVDAPAAVTRLRDFLESRPERAAVIECLTAMLIGH